MNDQHDEKSYDPKHRAFTLLTVAGGNYMHAAYLAMLADNPELARDFTAQFRDGRAHIGIYFEFNHDQLRAELALVPPEFAQRFEGAALRLNGPIEAAGRPPEVVSVTDLSKLN